MEENQVDETLQRGSVQIRPLVYGYVDFMALKSAVDLHIADTINSYGRPITLSEIASGIPDSPSPNIEKLGRIMRYLVRGKIVTAHHSPDGAGETLYELNSTSRCLLRDSKQSMLPIILFTTSVWQINSWQHLSECVKDGESAFKKAYGTEIWELASTNPEFNKIFNDSMACLTKMSIDPFLTTYKDKLGCVGSLVVDVGGGTGQYISEVVKKYPHIKGINFDLPHVISTAPAYDGVQHVGGDMFEAIPNADAIIAKWILHNWSDENCLKLLKNCRKAIPEKSGKVIILDAVLEPEGNGPLDDVHVMMDLMMMVISPNGKERTEIEWKKLLEEGGFPRYKITKIPTSWSSIIEAFPE